MTRKRSRSVLEPDLRPVRSSKRLHTIPVEEDLKRANARIQELEAQVKELQDYINSSHTATRKSTIRIIVLCLSANRN